MSFKSVAVMNLVLATFAFTAHAEQTTYDFINSNRGAAFNGQSNKANALRCFMMFTQGAVNSSNDYKCESDTCRYKHDDVVYEADWCGDTAGIARSCTITRTVHGTKENIGTLLYYRSINTAIYYLPGVSAQCDFATHTLVAKF